jgi:hypothetical protein
VLEANGKTNWFEWEKTDIYSDICEYGGKLKYLG